jgi:hypothetical protein
LIRSFFLPKGNNMATDMTDRGRYLLLKYAFDAESVPSTYQMKLVTDASVTKAINTFSELSECPNGSGYTTSGIGFAAANVTVTEEDSTVSAKAEIADNLAQWTATGTFPASGTGVTFLVITDGTGTDNVLGFVDLGGAQTMTSGGILTVNDLEFQVNAS